jgi:branched-chain amino acid transport system permease protein
MTRVFLRRAVNAGLIGAAVIWHVSLVGLVTSFQDRPIVTGLVSVGGILPVIVAPLIGYWAGSALKTGLRERPTLVVALLSGVVAGAVAGAGVFVLVMFITILTPNGMLIHATPALATDLLYGLDTVPGSLVVLVVDAALAAAAVLLHFMPRWTRRTIVWSFALVLIVGLMETFIKQILVNLPFSGVSDLLFTQDGLSPVGGAIVLVITAVAVAGWGLRGAQVKASYAALPRTRQQGTKVFAYVLFAAFVLLLPQVLGPFLGDVITNVGLFILLGLGLNIVVGFAGLLDLGYVAFYALGAYSVAVLTSPASPAFHPQLSFWVALPIVMLIGATVGLLIGAPVLRLRGDYLAIVTLGFGEIARIIFLSDWMTPYVGGANGIQQIPPPEIFGIQFRNPQDLYYPLLAAIIIAGLVAWSLYNSKVGRAWTAMREDETVAEATGVNTTVYKLMAFAAGAVFGTVAGAFYAGKIGVVFPQNLDILISINALSLIILGGMGNLAGVVVGALVLVGVPNLLREFAEYQLLIYGAVLVAMMLFRPEGLLPNRSRRAELHEEAGGMPGAAGGEPSEGGGDAGSPGGDQTTRRPVPAAGAVALESGQVHTSMGDNR